MKKYYLILPIFILAALALSACGSSVEKTLDSGNQAFVEQDYQQAMEKYAQAMEMDPELGEPTYNLANTLYRLEAFEEAGQFLAQAIQTASDQLAEHGFYNLGNNFFQQELMSEAVEAYKESLRMDSNDLDAKYNLELAMVQQEQQEQQQQEQEQEEQEDSSEDQQDSEQEQSEGGQEEQNQNQSEDSQDESDQSEQEQGEQDQPGDEGEDQEQQDQNQNGEPQENQEGQDGQGQPQQVEGLTEEQARQLLAAIGQSSETLQEKLQEIFGFAGMPPEKDW
jgi:Ca-activated chloride channel family protein